jgi:hypothetical protein
MREERVILEHETDSASVRRDSREIRAVEDDPTCVRHL